MQPCISVASLCEPPIYLQESPYVAASETPGACMICVPYTVDTSLIPMAGKGLFLSRPVAAGKVLVAPSKIQGTVTLGDLLDESNAHHLDSSIRWFEEHCTVSPDWPDECYVNHAFEATGLWHLGFIFAAQDLPQGAEITVDYRHLLAPGVDIGFPDSLTGRRIVGFRWSDSLRSSTAQLQRLLDLVDAAEQLNGQGAPAWAERFERAESLQTPA
ncbi:hypothetical protein HDN1F_08450 [gamma proteobacterium HdN1]|nr:hypothetical protein HDN1F_08450 [gamma proteobacterium HdN1]